MAEEAGESPAEPVPVGSRVPELVAVMDRLRRECPWDRRQTHASLAPYLQNAMGMPLYPGLP